MLTGCTSHHLECSQIWSEIFRIFMCSSWSKSSLVATPHSKQSSPHFRHIPAIFYGVKTDTTFYFFALSRLLSWVLSKSEEHFNLIDVPSSCMVWNSEKRARCFDEISVVSMSIIMLIIRMDADEYCEEEENLTCLTEEKPLLFSRWFDEIAWL